GEMEVWALEAYGAGYTLQEVLTSKSEDVVGRVQTYEAIVKGRKLPEQAVPESVKVLINELQRLGMDVKMFRSDESETDVRALEEEEKEEQEDLLNLEVRQD